MKRPMEPEFALALPAMELVRSPRSFRNLALALVLLCGVLAGMLILVPWQQNVAGKGRVTALSPLDRPLVIPAPVTGRLVHVDVREGSYVQKGDILAEMADQDPLYAQRLNQQLQLTQSEVRAGQDMLQNYNKQLEFLEDAREQAISGASYDLKVAIEKVRQAEQTLESAEAKLEQKRLDIERKRNLLPTGVVSELKFQEAEADFLSARADVGKARAAVEEARNEELSKMADVDRISNEQQAKIESAKSARDDAKAKLATVERKLTEANTKVERQKTQTIVAPRTGTVLAVHGANQADLITKGTPLIELVPQTEEMAVELWVRGIDAPLIQNNATKVRLQFEGWPAVQFAGWPSVAVGTFGGIVQIVDAHARADGMFRVVVVPDPEDDPWPEAPYLRQGGRANGWLLLNRVRLGYELWRQLNAFPPTVDKPGDLGPTSAAGKAGSGKGDAKGTKP